MNKKILWLIAVISSIAIAVGVGVFLKSSLLELFG